MLLKLCGTKQCFELCQFNNCEQLREVYLQDERNFKNTQLWPRQSYSYLRFFFVVDVLYIAYQLSVFKMVLKLYSFYVNKFIF